MTIAFGVIDGASNRALTHAPFRTMVDALAARARQKGDAAAFVFLRNGEAESDRLSFADLDRRAKAIAAGIAAIAGPGDRILLVHAPGLDFVATLFGCLVAGVIAVPVSPPRREQLRDKLGAIVADCAPRAIVMESDAGSDGGAIFGLQATLGIPVTTTDALETQGRDVAWTAAAIGPDTIGILQYTSGSTGTPKGVCVTHRNFLANSAMIHRAFGHGPTTTMVGWLPLFHDMGLVGCLMQPIYDGFLSVLMPPVAFVQRPSRWLRAISTYRATSSGGPNFGYELCVSRFRADRMEGVDLGSWEVAFNGAEPVRAATLRRFTETFAPYGFRARMHHPCYGMAEATLIISGGGIDIPPRTRHVDADALARGTAMEADGAPTREVVSCGSAIDDEVIRVVDPATSTPCDDDGVGEIWVRGENVSPGYWNKPDVNRAIFGAILAATGEGPFLRTGDLGFFHDGELYVTGRLKEIVILQGRNLYPHDIEAAVQASHDAFQPAGGVAFAVDGETSERLVVVQEVKHESDAADREPLLGAAREVVAAEFDAHLSELVLVRRGTLPKTSSGKLQRTLVRALYLGGRLKPITPEPARESAPVAV